VSALTLETLSIGSFIQHYGSPLYLYDLDKIEARFEQLNACLPRNFRVHYALKANSNLTINNLLARRGAAAEVSSLGEFLAALKSGYAPQETVFTGPGKSNHELAVALDHGIGWIVVESANEARRLDVLAAERNRKQPILLRINPEYRTLNSCDVSCAVGGGERLQPIAMNSQGGSKFGVDEGAAAAEMEAILHLSHVALKGIHIFTESNVLDYRHLLDAWRNTMAIADNLRAQGYPITVLDFGGGIGVPYNAVDSAFDTVALGRELAATFAHTPYHCILEMGRYIVCEAGTYITEVLDIKQSRGQRFAIVNGGVHHIYRTPAMQNASKFLTVPGKEHSETVPTTLAGQLPTPLDILVREAPLPADLAVGDLILIRNCGAYGFNHSLTNFALHPYPAEVAHRGDRTEVIRDRGTYDDFFLHQKLITF